jgi:hypothetical protein
MIVEKQMECRLAGETEVLGENCPSATFVPEFPLNTVEIKTQIYVESSVHGTSYWKTKIL